MGHHNHDNEECPKVPVVVAWLDACTAWLCVLVNSPVDGETINVVLRSAAFRTDSHKNVLVGLFSTRGKNAVFATSQTKHCDNL